VHADTLTATDRAVTRLTEPHTEWESNRPVERAPLLIELEDSATAQDKRGSGSGGAGIPINLGVIALQTHIKKRLKKMREGLFLPPARDIIGGTREAWERAKDERTGGRVDDTVWGNIETEFPDWVQRITEEISPPTTTEILAACTNCGETKAWVRGDMVSAVVVKWYPEELDRAPIAKCRFCEFEGVGWGYMHYSLDVVNRDVLAKLGIDVSNFARLNVLR
jgi:hypothetical protein